MTRINCQVLPSSLLEKLQALFENVRFFQKASENHKTENEIIISSTLWPTSHRKMNLKAAGIV